MKLAVISDIHDNLTNLKKCLSWCLKNNIKSTFCCGDVTNEETLNFLNKNFPSPIYLVRGNVEIFEDRDLENLKNIEYGGKVGAWKIDKLLIGACHEPYLIDKVLEKGDCDIVFYGHTHKPWEEERKGTRIINPGTLGGVFSLATFAVYNTDTRELELMILDSLN